jgi:hypothetical protein
MDEQRPEEKNEKGETPIQEVNRILEEQVRRSYGSKDRERKNKAKDYKTTSQLRAMKAGENIQVTPKKRIRITRGQLDKRTPQAIAIEEERERETAHAALSHCGERTLDETITKSIMDGMEHLQKKQQMYTKLGRRRRRRNYADIVKEERTRRKAPRTAVARTKKNHKDQEPT